MLHYSLNSLQVTDATFFPACLKILSRAAYIPRRKATLHDGRHGDNRLPKLDTMGFCATSICQFWISFFSASPLLECWWVCILCIKPPLSLQHQKGSRTHGPRNIWNRYTGAAHQREDDIPQVFIQGMELSFFSPPAQPYPPDGSVPVEL